MEQHDPLEMILSIMALLAIVGFFYLAITIFNTIF